MSRIDAVFFDLDETLVADTENYTRAFAVMTEKLRGSHPHVDGARVVAHYDTTAREFWQAREGTVVTTSSGETDGALIRREIWCQTAAACGYDDVIGGELAGIFMDCRSQTYGLFADALPLLDELRGKGIRMAAITNGPEDTQGDKLRRTGLEPYFEVVAYSGSVGYAKPAPEIFSFVLDKVGLDPANCWHIGDSLPNDVAGALASGLTAVWINRLGAVRQPQHPQPHHEVTSLVEFGEVLRRSGL